MFEGAGSLQRSKFCRRAFISERTQTRTNLNMISHDPQQQGAGIIFLSGRTGGQTDKCVLVLCLHAVCVCVSRRSSILRRAWPAARRRRSVRRAYSMLIGWLRCPLPSPPPEPSPSSLVEKQNQSSDIHHRRGDEFHIRGQSGKKMII